MRGKFTIFSRFFSHFCQLYYLDRIVQSILYDFENSSCAGVVANINFSRVVSKCEFVKKPIQDKHAKQIKKFQNENQNRV